MEATGSTSSVGKATFIWLSSALGQKRPSCSARQRHKEDLSFCRLSRYDLCETTDITLIIVGIVMDDCFLYSLCLVYDADGVTSTSCRLMSFTSMEAISQEGHRSARKSRKESNQNYTN